MKFQPIIGRQIVRDRRRRRRWFDGGVEIQRENFNDFVLLELEKEIGGTARSGRGEPVGYPWGAHYLPVPFQENAELIALLDEMSLIDGRDAERRDLVKEQYLCREPEERVFYKGRWYEGLI